MECKKQNKVELVPIEGEAGLAIRFTAIEEGVIALFTEVDDYYFGNLILLQADGRLKTALSKSDNTQYEEFSSAKAAAIDQILVASSEARAEKKRKEENRKSGASRTLDVLDSIDKFFA